MIHFNDQGIADARDVVPAMMAQYGMPEAHASMIVAMFRSFAPDLGHYYMTLSQFTSMNRYLGELGYTPLEFQY